MLTDLDSKEKDRRLDDIAQNSLTYLNERIYPILVRKRTTWIITL